jgi:hypothetical protein
MEDMGHILFTQVLFKSNAKTPKIFRERQKPIKKLGVLGLLGVLALKFLTLL